MGGDLYDIERRKRATLAGIIAGGGDVIEFPPGSGILVVVAIKGVPVDYPTIPVPPDKVLMTYEPVPGTVHYRPQDLTESQFRMAASGLLLPVNYNNQRIVNLADPATDDSASYQQAATSHFAQRQRSGGETTLCSFAGEAAFWNNGGWAGPNNGEHTPGSPSNNGDGASGFWIAPCAGSIQDITFIVPNQFNSLFFGDFDIEIWQSNNGPGGFFFTGVTLTLPPDSNFTHAPLAPGTGINVQKDDCIAFLNSAPFDARAVGQARINGRFVPEMLPFLF
jgi:hypothetical protein